jgi:hypothetical protein
MKTSIKILFSFIAFLFVFSTMYAMWSFTLLDINPANWTENSRFSFVIFGFFISAFAFVAVIVQPSKKD